MGYEFCRMRKEPVVVLYQYLSADAVFRKLSYSRVPFWLRKITTDPHILADAHTECPDDRYPKLKIYISELI